MIRYQNSVLVLLHYMDKKLTAFTQAMNHFQFDQVIDDRCQLALSFILVNTLTKVRFGQ